MPYGAKSRQAKDMPRVLRPSNLSMINRVTFDLTLFVVFLEILSPKKKKALVVTSARSLQNFLFKIATQKSLLLSQIRKFCNKDNNMLCRGENMIYMI